MILKKIKIKDIGRVVTGTTPTTKIQEYYGNEFDFIKPSYIEKGNRFFNDSEVKLSSLAKDDYGNTFVPPLSTCVVTIGSIGEKMCLTKELCLTNQQINTIIPNDNYDKLFVYYLMKHNLYKVKAANSGSSSGRENVSKSIFENLEVEAPDLISQQKISKILSAYDDLIENNFKRIKLLEETAELIYKEWFVNFRFPGYEKCEFADGIPRLWVKKSVMDSNYFNFIKENITRFDGKKKYYATADIQGISFVKDGEEIEWSNKPSRAQKQPQINSVWFARMKDSYKILAITRANREIAEECVLSSGFAGFSAKEDAFFPFLYSLVKSFEFNSQKDLLATGATQVSLNNEGISKIEFIEPTENVVRDYGKFILQIINKIFVLQKINNQLKEARDILIPKLITGEIEI